jgi:hypothetical protein
MPSPLDLTRHHALPRRYLGRDVLSGREGRGYTARDLFKFYGLIAALLFALALTYVKYLDLFAEAMKPDANPAMQVFAVLTIVPLLMVLVALEGFFWWAGGALVDYARWQRVDPRLWRWFWFIVLNFYFIMVTDPFDRINRLMTRNGLFPAPNLILLFSGKLETFQFQWGYFLLWALFWFLILIAHVSYLADGLREVWFYTKRINRYSASVLTGFRGTAAVAMDPPVTRTDWPMSSTVMAPGLALERLTQTQAEQIIAADLSGAISAVPGQRGVLLVDLGAFHWSPGLSELRDESGNPLLYKVQIDIDPTGSRSSLVVPLRGDGVVADLVSPSTAAGSEEGTA